MSNNFAIFDTAIGACGIFWNTRGIAGVQIHDGTEAATRSRLLRRFAGAQEAKPPVHVQQAIDGVVALLRGEKRDLNDVTIDTEDLPEFNRRVYVIARTIPPGSTLTYGEIAERLGDKLLAREVGQALGQNPIPLIVPCHRVIRSDGTLCGYGGGRWRKQWLLEHEQAVKSN